jgi:hypothetical protein
VFDILLSGDAYVPDHDAAVRQAATELGIRQPDPKRFTRNPMQRVTWSMTRAHPDRRLAPTLLEFLATLPAQDGWEPGPEYDGVPEIAASQGDRPARLHSTPVGVADVAALVERLSGLGVAHRLSEPSEHYPFPRLWVGHDPDRPGTHDHHADGGTHLEFLPTSVLGLPSPEPGTAAPGEVGAGAAVRIVARTLLVDDVADTVRRYREHFGWEPEAEPSRGVDGVLRARFQPSYPRSAALELIEPDPGVHGYESDFARDHGSGACSIRFAARDLDSVAERLASLGTRCVEAAGLDGPDGGRRLIRPAEFALGTAFEYVEWDGS